MSAATVEPPTTPTVLPLRAADVLYVAASAFNVPFTGYAGVAFFLLMHWLRSELLKSQGARRLVSVG